MYAEDIVIIIFLTGIVMFLLFVGYRVYESDKEYEKQKALKEMFAKEDCKIQSFYELNFDLCFRVGVKP